MDFVTGLDEVIADSYDEPPPKNLWEKFWQWIVSTPSLVPFSQSWSPYSFAFTGLGGRKPNQQWRVCLVFLTCTYYLNRWGAVSQQSAPKNIVRSGLVQTSNR